ncbi:TfuA-like protein [Streptomyces sp. AP-93]|uniref:TfuA-like protein n=1 Tax=Streptomyces sp. AP-93 TaxID=2929048 RepID=UPI001FAF46DF|nr:TfuA-like protein [Streptomyces sp. AP-93]MCJ0868089.1 TfuA-like protein [Streptomyces sp. AP-93]
MTVHVFTGPTIPADDVHHLLPDAVCHPPVSHGDLLRLGLARTDIALIIDGLWHQTAPIRHKELLAVMATGVRVVGAASMGALRAAELAPYGMLGVGRVYESYASGALEADDEVAVLHTPEGHKITEALVNMRTAIDRATTAGRLGRTDAQALLELARSLPYTRRTWKALGYAAEEASLTCAFDAVNSWRQTHPYDLKRADAEEALAILLRGLPAPARTAPWRGERWQTSFVRYWTAAFQPDRTGIPLLALLQHQQLYDPRFPARWRQRVLANIGREHSGLPEEAALTAAREAGTSTTDLSPAQRAHWFTSDEERLLDPGEGLRRIMVRSARLDGAWTVWPATHAEALPLLDTDLDTEQRVAHAFRVNDAAQANNPRHTPAHLDAGRITTHLLSHWGLPTDADQETRDAAARDRAFRDFVGAVETCRAYYLGARAAEVTSDPSAPSGTGAVMLRT